MKKIMYGALAIFLLLGIIPLNLLADEELLEVLSEPGGEYVEETEVEDAEEADVDIMEDTEEAEGEEAEEVDAENTEDTEETDKVEGAEEVDKAGETILPPTVVIPRDSDDVIIVDKRIYLEMERLEREGRQGVYEDEEDS